MTDAQSRIDWPAGHRAAMSLLVHVPGTGLVDEGTGQSDLVGLDYTVTGLQRIFEQLADLDVTATIAFGGDAAESAPQLVRRAMELGHEVAATACSATGSTDDLLDTISRLTDERVNGLVEQLPGFQVSEPEGAFGNDSGRAWRITGAGGDLPVLLRDADATVFPVSPYLMDTAWLSPTRPLPRRRCSRRGPWRWARTAPTAPTCRSSCTRISWVVPAWSAHSSASSTKPSPPAMSGSHVWTISR